MTLSFWKKPLSRDIAIIILAVFLLTLPFINKAFDWDDREFIDFARVYSENPAQQHLEDLDYKGIFYPEFRTSHPPLLSYYLSLLLRLGFSVSEPLFRSAYLIFPLIAAVSMYFLARRFTRHALTATLLLIVTPGFFVTSHSLMGDLPGLAFWLLSTALFVYGCDRDSWKLLLGAGLAMSLGVMIAYQALSLIPLFIFYALIRRRFRLRVFVPLALPVLAFAAYALMIRMKYDGWPVLSYNVGVRWGLQDFELKLRALLVFIGGAIVFPFAVIPLFMRRKIDLFIGFLLLPPLVTWAAVYYLGEDELTLSQALLLALFVAAGFLVCYRMLATSVSAVFLWLRQRRDASDQLFLLAWFAGVATYVAVFLPFVTVRFLLPLFPPVVLLFMRVAEGLWPMKPRLRSAFILATLGLTLATGLAAALADYHLAGTYRTVAAELGERYRDGSGRRLWVLSEFGARYYLQEQGFEYLGPSATGDREPRKGDIVVISKVNASGVTGPLREGSFRVLEEIRPGDSLPVRMIGEEAGAGFYSHLVGPLPMTISEAPLDEITVYELYWDE